MQDEFERDAGTGVAPVGVVDAAMRPQGGCTAVNTGAASRAAVA